MRTELQRVRTLSRATFIWTMMTDAERQALVQRRVFPEYLMRYSTREGYHGPSLQAALLEVAGQQRA